MSKLPLPAALNRSGTAPAAFVTRSRLGSLNFTGDPCRPFADLRRPPQIGSGDDSTLPLRTRVSSSPRASLVHHSWYSPAASPASGEPYSPGRHRSMSASPTHSELAFYNRPQAGSTPIHVEQWQIVGQRMASIFQDPGLWSYPCSPVHSPAGCLWSSNAPTAYSFGIGGPTSPMEASQVSSECRFSNIQSP